MTQLSQSKDILVLSPTAQDLAVAARYAAISMPWTYNRLSKDMGSFGQRERGLNIAKGIVAQEMLKRELTKLGIAADPERKSHRDEDLFDLEIQLAGQRRKFDLKSWNHYSDYGVVGRPPFSLDLLMDNADYAGPEWGHFFPMLVPHDQTSQTKEAFCFAMSSSLDFRRDIDSDRIDNAITAFPFGEMLCFLHSPKLCALREEQGRGVRIGVSWEPGLTEPQQISLYVIGERDGNNVWDELVLKAGAEVVSEPYSCVTAVQLIGDTHREWICGRIILRIARNNLKCSVLNYKREDINKAPTLPLILQKGDFCNLILPTNYKMFVIGWTYKDAFLERCRQYTGWVWPSDKSDRLRNQPWDQITDDDRRRITAAGFDDCIHGASPRLRAGWMKTARGLSGACCYVYPNMFRGGVKNTNVYVLPADLETMRSLAE